MIPKTRFLARVIPCGAIASCVVACAEALPPSNYYLVLSANDDGQKALSKIVLGKAFENSEDGGNLAVDLIDQGTLQNLLSAPPSNQTVRPLLNLQLTPADPAALPLVIQRAGNLTKDMSEGERLIAVIVSAGTDDPQLLGKIKDETKRLSALEHRSIHLVIVGIDPAKRLAFSSAFEPTRTFTTFASSTEEFMTQIDKIDQGE
jgi:hypothetical protein